MFYNLSLEIKNYLKIQLFNYLISLFRINLNNLKTKLIYSVINNDLWKK